MRFVVRVVVNAFAIWIVTQIPELKVSVVPFASGSDLALIGTFLAVALLFGVVNGIVGTLIKIVAFPLYIVTLGLITFVVNGFLLWLTAWITHGWNWGLRVEDFGWGILAALVIWLINWIAGMLLRPRKRR